MLIDIIFTFLIDINTLVLFMIYTFYYTIVTILIIIIVVVATDNFQPV